MSLNWSVFAVQRLRDLEERKTAAENITEQIKVLEQRFKAVRSATTDGTAVQGGSLNKREEMLIQNISMREELKANRDIITREIELTEKALEKLTEEERLILTRFFIKKSKGYIERLCEELYTSKTGLYKRKDAALKRFTMIFYGIVEL